MTFSFNEIESMGKRAARGAGLSWGLAEEAGKAARWLAEHDEPGAQILARRLNDIDGLGYESLAPRRVDGVWCAPRGVLCPLIAGPILSDWAADIADGGIVLFGAVADPIFLAPYAAAVVKQTGVAMKLCWNAVALTVTADGMAVDGPTEERDLTVATDVSCTAATATPAVSLRAIRRCAVDAETWRRLEAFALRTFAPATEASRMAGAGAGLDDND